ncbi:MAG: amidohydrolase/deacetylase family metallohydrolase [Candidatus Latescibacterota bacterium]|jgi:dihydroorotase|nr:amidohydrolase/deacetylase family metallohydrolase [Candidatus Latescibacterota bacterium]MEC8992934.1 amidohydrolase/deacetylase family metallohydrolase [Candidatus Latescibacterota bacterium]MED5413666.1 amidohydrolase/deacetylase family metallohydrolase [Candidatus Latescibacterota bacterium]MEE3039369.1 amidohydrolase/deacetylase family metallohydrolase [Candidatus Latescibacterota bacterium]
MKYELLLKGGHVIDPANGVDTSADVAIRGGRIEAVKPDIPAETALSCLDMTGLYVTPGLVDIHVHLYATAGNPGAWAGDNSVLPDGFSFRAGTTTMVDTGSAGWRNFGDFRHRVLDRFTTRTYGLVNIAGLGMATMMTEQNVHDLNAQQCAAVAREHEDVVVGLKTAHYVMPDWTSVDRVLAAGDLAQMPAMIDFGHFKPERPYYELVGQRLRPGDISTHMYRGPVPCIDEGGRVYSYLRDARDRGIRFDVGHGAGSFCFRNAVPCVEQGFWPDSISTDLHRMSMNIGMLDMPTTMSKFLVMGMPLADVIRLSTIEPARVIGRPQHGHLTVGAAADVAVLRIDEGDFGYMDAFGGVLRGDRRFICELTVCDGEIVWDLNGRSGSDYRILDPEYGVRDVEELIRPPRP